MERHRLQFQPATLDYEVAKNIIALSASQNHHSRGNSSSRINISDSYHEDDNDKALAQIIFEFDSSSSNATTTSSSRAQRFNYLVSNNKNLCGNNMNVNEQESPIAPSALMETFRQEFDDFDINEFQVKSMERLSSGPFYSYEHTSSDFIDIHTVEDSSQDEVEPKVMQGFECLNSFLDMSSDIVSNSPAFPGYTLNSGAYSANGMHKTGARKAEQKSTNRQQQQTRTNHASLQQHHLPQQQQFAQSPYFQQRSLSKARGPRNGHSSPVKKVEPFEYLSEEEQAKRLITRDRNQKYREKKLTEDPDDYRRRKSEAQKRYLERKKMEDPDGFRRQKSEQQKRYMERKSRNLIF